jgi:hypothetical protein
MEKIRIRDPRWKKLGSRMEKNRIRDKHSGSATLVINQDRKIIIFKHLKKESLPLRSCLDRERTSPGVGAVPPPSAQSAHHNRAPAAQEGPCLCFIGSEVVCTSTYILTI